MHGIMGWAEMVRQNLEVTGAGIPGKFCQRDYEKGILEWSDFCIPRLWSSVAAVQCKPVRVVDSISTRTVEFTPR